MGEKYKVKKSALKNLFAIADVAMSSTGYHTLYERLGWKKNRNGNFHCFNQTGHARGDDVHPSMSVDNATGVWNCFACGVKGNFQSYWSDQLKGTSYGESYTDFIVDFLHLQSQMNIGTSDSDDKQIELDAEAMQTMFLQMKAKYEENNGKPYIMSSELVNMAKKNATIPMDKLDGWVETLLANQPKMQYLEKTRGITVEVIQRYRIGLDERGRYVFPMINSEGDFINAKLYDPTNKATEYKWVFAFKGRPVCPTPMVNFTNQKLYFFEGEPDLYCAISFGIEGAVTLGSKATYDVNTVFSPEEAKRLFYGKEIVICLDSDGESRVPAAKLAHSLYPYAKQIKVLDLDKSDINPFGLNQELMKTITKGDKIKEKRSEKDFTDFLIKNGFNDAAKKKFTNLEEATKVYTENDSRERREIYKTTLQECRYPQYFSADGSKVLEITASVSDYNSNAYMYPIEFSVTCDCIANANNCVAQCKHCSMPSKPGFGESDEIKLKLNRDVSKEDALNPLIVKINEHNILGLIEVTDAQKQMQLKKVCNINSRCASVNIIDTMQEKIMHVGLARDVTELNAKSSNSDSGSNDIEVEAYICGEMDLFANRSYKIHAVQTTAWNGQHAVLFAHSAEPIITSIDAFTMDQEAHNILTLFQQKNGETVAQCLERKYEVLANAAGVSGRRELFLINDLVFFSPAELNNKKILPQVSRGWVEALIAGDPRTCKSLISKFLQKHYKIGDMVAGSSALTRTGLVGGVVSGKNKNRIKWGKIPMNDRGIVIIDELSKMSAEDLDDMTPCRSEGIASIDKIQSGRALARTRKIMLSNARVYKSEDNVSSTYGINLFMNICMKNEVFARFDIAFIVKKDDIDMADFKPSYNQISTDYNEFQCQRLIMWAYSRTSDDVVWEDGAEDLVNASQALLLEKYHSQTQLINQETRAKLVRMAISLATMLYSIQPDDWNKILVKKEHIEYIVNFLDTLYSHPNMRLDEYSKMMWRKETLGDMAFMDNICKHIAIKPIFYDDEFSERAVQQLFMDYLYKVHQGKLYMVDSDNDQNKTTGIRLQDSIHKLISTLVARNCFTRTKRGTYHKTEMFNKWLSQRLERSSKEPCSDILEVSVGQQNNSVLEKIKQLERLG